MITGYHVSMDKQLVGFRYMAVYDKLARKPT